jgi:hypothetical protein
MVCKNFILNYQKNLIDYGKHVKCREGVMIKNKKSKI